MTDVRPTQTGLDRSLGLGQVALIGLAYMTPLIVLGTFGVLAHTTGGAVPTAYLVTLVAMLFTAYSYGRMASAHPVAGSAYTYVGRSMDLRLGFLTGWAILLDYVFLPLVIWLIGASYLSARFPEVPMAVWIVAFIAVTTALNVLGIKVAARANLVLMAFQLLVLGVFVALSLADALRGPVDPMGPFTGDGTTQAMVAAGAALAAYSFVGFDAVTTLTEEARDPRRTIPRAVLITALACGLLFVVASYATQLAHPGGAFDDVDSAAFEIAADIGGRLFSSVFLAGLIVAQFASGLAAQATASRLLFAMGRDGTLPRRLFGAVQARLRTPVFNLVLVGVIGLGAIALDLTTSTSFINFGAFSAFTMVNLSVIAHWLRHRPGGGAGGVLAWVVVPLVGAVIDVYLLVNLDGHALLLGCCWLAAGVVLLAILTRGFRGPVPRMSMDEEAAP
ncbi:amino acid transporter [Spinactinospora alkalitolerans]|uniref:Amino acid transporter n=1 Tax=Spinactinospora alkalitolerans TaxID=687207 RepID=A0A852TYM0_9ACTN|nr:APC family permease [Spinactinospora alkalitolerans]NYE48435.1 amino acid transporter [Spinactinospora alkalitolerans]